MTIDSSNMATAAPLPVVIFNCCKKGYFICMMYLINFIVDSLFQKYVGELHLMFVAILFTTKNTFFVFTQYYWCKI